MTDKLEDIYAMQQELDEIIAQKWDLIYPQWIMDSEDDPESVEAKNEVLNEWLIQMCLCMFSETNELLNETQWKHWKLYTDVIDKAKARKEATDLLFFAMSICQKLEMSPDDIHAEFTEKYQENIARQNNQSKEGKNYGK